MIDLNEMCEVRKGIKTIEQFRAGDNEEEDLVGIGSQLKNLLRMITMKHSALKVSS